MVIACGLQVDDFKDDGIEASCKLIESMENFIRKPNIDPLIDGKHYCDVISWRDEKTFRAVVAELIEDKNK